MDRPAEASAASTIPDSDACVAHLKASLALERLRTLAIQRLEHDVSCSRPPAAVQRTAQELCLPMLSGSTYPCLCCAGAAAAKHRGGRAAQQGFHNIFWGAQQPAPDRQPAGGARVSASLPPRSSAPARRCCRPAACASAAAPARSHLTRRLAKWRWTLRHPFSPCWFARRADLSREALRALWRVLTEAEGGMSSQIDDAIRAALCQLHAQELQPHPNAAKKVD